MLSQSTLRERLLTREPISQVRLPSHSARDPVQAAIERGRCDLIYTDAQHRAISEWDIIH